MPPAATGSRIIARAYCRTSRRWGRSRESTRGDVNLYHVGNNALHREIYRRRAGRTAVLSVLHDAVLQHFPRDTG